MSTRGEKVSAAILTGSLFLGGGVGYDAAKRDSRDTLAALSWADEQAHVVIAAIQGVLSDSGTPERPNGGPTGALPTAPSQTPSGEASQTAPSSAPSSYESSSAGGERQKAPIVGTLVGDSITYGYYPTFLMERLQKDGYDIRLVGDRNNVGEPSYPNCGTVAKTPNGSRVTSKIVWIPRLTSP